MNGNVFALFECALLLPVNVYMHFACVGVPVDVKLLQSNGHFLVVCVRDHSFFCFKILSVSTCLNIAQAVILYCVY